MDIKQLNPDIGEIWKYDSFYNAGKPSHTIAHWLMIDERHALLLETGVVHNFCMSSLPSDHWTKIA